MQVSVILCQNELKIITLRCRLQKTKVKDLPQNKKPYMQNTATSKGIFYLTTSAFFKCRAYYSQEDMLLEIK